MGRRSARPMRNQRTEQIPLIPALERLRTGKNEAFRRHRERQALATACDGAFGCRNEQHLLARSG